MTKKEIEKKFPFSGKDGECADCEYVDTCDKILPGLNKPGKCAGPFHKDDEKKDRVIRLSDRELRDIVSESVSRIVEAMSWEEYVMSQEDPRETAAKEWAQENGIEADENIIRAFVAGVDLGRQL